MASTASLGLWLGLTGRKPGPWPPRGAGGCLFLPLPFRLSSLPALAQHLPRGELAGKKAVTELLINQRTGTFRPPSTHPLTNLFVIPSSFRKYFQQELYGSMPGT